MQIQNGSILLERYSIIKLLNEGGMSFIYLAEDIKLHQRKVVCKMMKVQYSSQNHLIEKEAETLIALHHPYLPQIYDIFLYDQFPVIVMEYVEGVALSEVHALSQKQKLHVLYQLCEVMTYLHERPVPILHCDLKPSNILLDYQFNLKLIDFGISSYELKRSEHYVTDNKMEFGTPMYMAPEIVNGERPTTASDLYSFALITLYLWGKEKLFLAHSNLTVEQFVSGYLGELSLEMKDMLYYLLQPHPKNRKYTFKELKQLLVQWYDAMLNKQHNSELSYREQRQIIAVVNINKCAGSTTIATLLSQVLKAKYNHIACIEIASEDANLYKSYLGSKVTTNQTLFGYYKVMESSINYYFQAQCQHDVNVVQLQKIIDQLEEECIIVDFSSITSRFSLLHYLGEVSTIILVSTSDVYICNDTQIVNVINNLDKDKGNVIHINNKAIVKEHSSFLERWLHIKQYIELPYLIDSKSVKQKVLGKWLNPKVKMGQMITSRLQKINLS